MNKISRLIQDYPKVSAVLISLFISANYIFISGVKFDTNDDPEMMLTNMGAFAGYHDIHNVFINYLLSGLMINLYSLSPLIPWYECLTLIFLLVSLSTITYVILKKTINYWLLLVYVLVLLGFLSKCISSFQFTKTAFLLCLAGILLSLDINLKIINWKKLLFVFGLLILSGMVRFHAFFMACIVISPYVLYVMISDNRKLFSTAVIFCALVCNLGLYKAHTNYYNTDKAWSKFLSELGPKSNILNYSTTSIDTVFFNNQLKQIGWSKNDFLTMRCWFYIDSSVYSITKFNKLNIAYPISERDWIKGNYTKTLIKFFKETIHYWFFITLWFCLLFLFFESNKKHKLFLAFHLFFILAFMFFMFYYLKLEARIFTPIVFCLVITTFLFPYKIPEYKFALFIKNGFILFLSIVVSYYSYKGYLGYALAKKNQDKLELILKQQPINHKNISLSYGFPFNDLVPFKNCNYLLNANIIPISTLVCSPLFHQSYQRHGIDNLLTFIAKGKNYTFWVFKGNGIDVIETYYEEHYSIHLKFVKINEVGNNYLYSPVISNN